MKKIFLLISIVSCTTTLSQPLKARVYSSGVLQPSIEDVLKFKISVITIKDSGNSNIRNDYYFDKKGNDTALYVNGVLVWFKEIKQDKYGKPLRWTQYGANGLEQYIANYDYENDGVYTITYYHEGLRRLTEKYNKQRKLQSQSLNDGGQHFYIYDSASRLKKIYSQAGLDNLDLYDADYAYNNKGQLANIKISYYSPVDVDSFTEFTYDTKGLLLKTICTTVNNGLGGEKNVFVTIYSYVFSEIILE